MTPLERILRLWHTVRHLRGEQVRGQVLARLRRAFENPAHLERLATPAFPGIRWRPGEFLAPGERHPSRAEIRRGEFVFLNDHRNIGWPPDWEAAGAPRLWQYNLHYFDWIWSLPYGDARDAALDWMRRHRPARGAVGWEPYPVSLRVQNWCAFFFGRHAEETGHDTEFRDLLWASLYRQLHWLARHLETHLLGNHLFENAVALAAAGACFAGEDAGRWLGKGRAILKREIAEQVLPDGMHFERSPMYHQRLLFTLLTLWRTGEETLRTLVGEPMARAAAALGHLCHPDGRIALCNDSAFGVYNPPLELVAAVAQAFQPAHNGQAGKPAPHFSPCPGRHVVSVAEAMNVGGNGAVAQAGKPVAVARAFQPAHSGQAGKPAPLASTALPAIGPWALPEAGYYGWRSAHDDYVVCDAGPIGPDYLPGHAHGDMFSFELSLHGHRVIVDAGVHDYEAGDLRRYCRSTRAHNTVEIEGQDQCEFWGAFRVARRGRPHDVTWTPSSSGFVLEGWHDGYERLPGAPRHARRFEWREPGQLIVRDRVTASRPVRAVSRLRLHPACRIEKMGTDRVTVTGPGGRFEVTFQGNGRLTIEDSQYFPEFGRKEESQTLSFSLEGGQGDFGFDIRSLA